jgi:hypothetical protein
MGHTLHIDKVRLWVYSFLEKGTREMAKIVPCRFGCGWEGKSGGRAGHEKLSHGRVFSQDISQEIPKSSQDNSQESRESSQEKEDTPMPEEKSGSEFCPTCHQPHGGVQELKFKAELAERDHKAALQEKSDELGPLRAQITTLQAEVEAAKNQEPVFPAVDDFVEHCKTCDTHKPQLRQFMDKVMSAMSPDEVKTQMKRLHIEPAPDRIIIGVGERELKR